MLFTTFPQLIALVILFLGGLFLGLGLHPGGRKWRRRFKDESDNYAKFRSDADIRLRDANARIAELEREKASRSANPGLGSASGPAVTGMASPAIPAASRGTTDPADLVRIRGIDHPLKADLAAAGITHFTDITDMTPADEAALEQRLSLPAGYIAREQWREQAALLRDGHNAEHAERFALG